MAMLFRQIPFCRWAMLHDSDVRNPRPRYDGSPMAFIGAYARGGLGGMLLCRISLLQAMARQMLNLQND